MGLIEVLVAVLILSIGLLGVAFVQTRSLSGNNSSMARSMAVIASYSILDAMRADRARAASGEYDGQIAADNCPTAGSSLKSVQLSAWCAELGARLGAAGTTVGAIDCEAGACTVTITFDDSGIGIGGSATQQVVTRAIL